MGGFIHATFCVEVAEHTWPDNPNGSRNPSPESSFRAHKSITNTSTCRKLSIRIHLFRSPIRDSWDKARDLTRFIEANKSAAGYDEDIVPFRWWPPQTSLYLFFSSFHFKSDLKAQQRWDDYWNILAGSLVRQSLCRLFVSPWPQWLSCIASRMFAFDLL